MHLPVTNDDGAARHLAGARLPPVLLPASDGTTVDLARLRGRTVIFFHPLIGAPGRPNPPGWDVIPGAHGSTPQACGFRDRHATIRQLGVARVFGVSTQAPAEQKEAAARLALPYLLLSDERLVLAGALTLPTFAAGGRAFLTRLTLVADDQRIARVFYPVVPPDRSAADVVAWLGTNPLGEV
jgi:peroxiredoxin